MQAQTTRQLNSDNRGCSALQHRCHSHRHLHLKLRPGPQAASEARHALDRLERTIDPAQLETIRLLVTELITNAVRHAGSHEWIDLDVEVRRDSVRGEVCDCGPGFVRPMEPEPHEHHLGGYGLCLVDRLSDRWGVEADALTRVWFELMRAEDGEYATAY